MQGQLWMAVTLAAVVGCGTITGLDGLHLGAGGAPSAISTTTTGGTGSVPGSTNSTSNTGGSGVGGMSGSGGSVSVSSGSGVGGGSVGAGGGSVGVGGGSVGAAGGGSSGPATLACAEGPYTNDPVPFTSSGSVVNLPAGTYTLTYVSGAITMKPSFGYVVTEHYTSNAVNCGYHIVSGTEDFWPDTTGLSQPWPTVAQVEQSNAAPTWTFQHAGGPLSITLLDDWYGDNGGPGSVFCISQ